MPDSPFTSTTTLSAYEMADLLNLLADVAAGRLIRKDRRREAEELRDSIIAGTPIAQRVGS